MFFDFYAVQMSIKIVTKRVVHECLVTKIFLVTLGRTLRVQLAVHHGHWMSLNLSVKGT